MMHGLFTKGGFDLVEFFMEEGNKQLARDLPVALKERSLELLDKKDDELVIERLQVGIELRLRHLVPYIRTWSQVLLFQSYDIAAYL
jgi:hypothetical protein